MTKKQAALKFFNEHSDIMSGRVQDDIKKNRMGKCKIRFVDLDGVPLKNTSVKINQETHDFRFGANIFMLDEFKDEKDNTAYKEFFKNTFNFATVPFYWDTLEPEKGKPRYSADSRKIFRRPAPDLCLDFCEKNGIEPKLHCLFYDKFIPDWLPKNDADEMRKYYIHRFKTIGEKYSSRIKEIEVTNETLQERWWKGQSVLSGERDIVDWCFSEARKYFPDNTLIINEGNPVPDVAEADYRSAFFMQIEGLLQRNAPIDKIGIQHHYFSGATGKKETEADVEREASKMLNPRVILKALDILSELNKPLQLTEITVPTFEDTEEYEEVQAEVIKNLYSIWFSHPAVDSIVYWNTVDGYAYEGPGWNENLCRGGLLHKDLTPKKSAVMLKKLIKEIWHTDLELITDENGCVDFLGFYGRYNVFSNGKNYSIGLHKNDNNEHTIVI